MRTLTEIKTAIMALSAVERAKLKIWLSDQPEPKPGRMALPDQAARRRGIYGKTVLPNMVLFERKSKLLQ